MFGHSGDRDARYERAGGGSLLRKGRRRTGCDVQCSLDWWFSEAALAACWTLERVMVAGGVKRRRKRECLSSETTLCEESGVGAEGRCIRRGSGGGGGRDAASDEECWWWGRTMWFRWRLPRELSRFVQW
jgi:hypothetical protein